MSYRTRIVTVASLQEARQQLAQIGCDPAGVSLMAGKMMLPVLKLEGLPTKAANLLKQTFLAKGGDVAVSRGTADLSVEATDVLVFATVKQYRLALAQLRQQPWGLPQVAAEVEQVLAAQLGGLRREYAWADGRTLAVRPGKTLVMGILNVTPDSFSDGGRYQTVEAALAQAAQLVADGADIIDIGAESTRPYGGNKEISAEEELERLLPVLEPLARQVKVPISVDTYKARVAEAALQAGAHIINDVWGLQRDEQMASVAARHGVPVVVMHNQLGTAYPGDLVGAVMAFLQRSLQLAAEAGVDAGAVWIDPGIGFAKTQEQNLEIMSRLEEFRSLGCPLLVGTSRKRFIGEVLGGLPVEERLEGTAATVVWSIAKGAQIVRVHDVKAMARAARMADAMQRRESEDG